MACATFGRALVFLYESRDWLPETQETSSRLVKVFQELRIDDGPGYRVYFVKQGQTVIVLLAGGDKSTQAADIRTALRLARNL